MNLFLLIHLPSPIFTQQSDPFSNELLPPIFLR